MLRPNTSLQVLVGLAFGAAAITVACTQFNPTEFVPYTTQSYPSTGKPAAVPTDTEESLVDKGYIRIGDLRVEREFAPGVDTIPICLAEAGQNGGHLAVLRSRNERRTKTLEEKSCVRKSYLHTSELYCAGDGKPCYSRPITKVTCEQFTTEVTGELQLVYSTATVWRHEPKLARLEVISTRDLPAAIHRKDVKAVGRLLDEGANPNQLEAAGRSGSAEIFELLTARGAEVKPEHMAAAISGGLKSVVPKLLQKGVPADNAKPTDYGERPIVTAVKMNDVDTLRLLVSKGARADISRHDKEPVPLFLAIETGNVELVRAALGSSGGSPTWSRYHNGRSTSGIVIAARTRNAEMMRMLLGLPGGTLNDRYYNNWTPLMQMVREGNTEAVRLLLSSGADPNKVNDYGRYQAQTRSEELIKSCCTPVEIARNYGHKDVEAELLKAGANEGPKVATVALSARHPLRQKVALVTIPPGTKISSTGAANKTTSRMDAIKYVKLGTGKSESWSIVLIQGASSGALSRVKSALSKDGDVNAAILGSNVSALMAAAENGHTDVAAALLDAGANADHVAFTGGALAYAALGGHEATAKLLLERGANPNLRAEMFGQTPLHLAALKGHTGIVAELIAWGADPTVKNSAGKTPLELAKEGKRTGTVEFLSYLQPR